MELTHWFQWFLLTYDESRALGLRCYQQFTNDPCAELCLKTPESAPSCLCSQPGDTSTLQYTWWQEKHQVSFTLRSPSPPHLSLPAQLLAMPKEWHHSCHTTHRPVFPTGSSVWKEGMTSTLKKIIFLEFTDYSLKSSRKDIILLSHFHTIKWWTVDLKWLENKLSFIFCCIVWARLPFVDVVN